MENEQRQNRVRRTEIKRNRIRRNRKRMRQKRNKRIMIVCSILGVIFAVVLAFFSLFRVTDVKVAGNTRHSDDMIIQYVQEDLLTTNTMLVSWFRKSIEVEDIPFVDSLDIEMLDNHTIRIYVNEKQIVGYVVENDHKMFFDKDGYVLEIMPMTQEEQESIQTEKDRFEQLRREEEGMLPETENPDEEVEPSEGEYSNEEMDPSEGEYSNEEMDPSEHEEQQGTQAEENLENSAEQTITGNEIEQGFDVDAPQVPWILGLDKKELSDDTRIIVDDTSVFNTIQGIWRISSKYEIIPEKVLFDEKYNITLVYQGGTVLCELGPDAILEEKMTRVAAILPNLTDKIGILHLEEYDIGTEGIIFSQESEYTVRGKINRFL